MQTILTSREFNQDTSGAKRAASHGPVFITDRGKPAHVLLSIEEYQRLTGGPGSIRPRVARPTHVWWPGRNAVATRNVADFLPTGVALINLWAFAG